MAQRTKPLPVVFFATSSGREPVREWLKGLEKDDRREIGASPRRVAGMAPRAAT